MRILVCTLLAVLCNLGVCWDPLNEWVASQSSDRTVRIFKLNLESSSKVSKKSASKKARADHLSLTSTIKSFKFPILQTSSTSTTTTTASTTSTTSAASTTESSTTPTSSSTTASPTSAPAIRPISAFFTPMKTSPKQAPTTSSPTIFSNATPLFYDDTMPTFYRRLTSSPDGEFLIAPAGMIDSNFLTYKFPLAATNDKPLDELKLNSGDVNADHSLQNSDNAMQVDNDVVEIKILQPKPKSMKVDSDVEEIKMLEPKRKLVKDKQRSAQNITDKPLSNDSKEPETKQKTIISTTYLFHRSNLSTPIAHFPTPEPSIAVRFSHIRYAPIQSTSSKPFIPLSYRMVFVIATVKSLFFYDTHHLQPLAIVSQLHLSALTDIAFSSAGDYLVVSSTDGYASIVTWEPNQFGDLYQHPENSSSITT